MSQIVDSVQRGHCVGVGFSGITVICGFVYKLNYTSGHCGTVAAKQKPSLKPIAPLKGSIHCFDIYQLFFFKSRFSEVPNLRATIVAALCREQHSGDFPQILPSLLQG